MEKKKNSGPFIIPPSYFKAIGVTPIAVKRPEIETVQKPKVAKTISKTSTEAIAAAEPKPIPKISIQTVQKTTSGLSLKSIREKKAHQIKQMDVVVDEEALPREAVSQDALDDAWKAYILTLNAKGEKIMASILEMDQPKLVDTDIKLQFANDTLKLELERAQYPLMTFLRQTLKNYDLKLDITVSEEVAKKYAFTPLEKYEKLNEKNPNLELLKKTFGLDV